MSPWSVHDHITIAPYCVIVACSYCSCFMTHFGLLLADMIIHDFYSVVSGPTSTSLTQDRGQGARWTGRVMSDSRVITQGKRATTIR